MNYITFQSRNIKIDFLKQKLINFLKSHLRKPKDYLKGLLGRSDWEFIEYKLKYSDQSHYRFKQFDPLSQDLYEIFHITVLPTLLRNYDRYSMSSGVEIRMPFMDHRLVTYTFSLPWTSKVGGTYKTNYEGRFKRNPTRKIRTRRDKIGWNAPLHEWLQGSLRKEIDLLISYNLLSKKARKAWEKFQENKTKF